MLFIASFESFWPRAILVAVVDSIRAYAHTHTKTLIPFCLNPRGGGMRMTQKDQHGDGLWLEARNRPADARGVTLVSSPGVIRQVWRDGCCRQRKM